MMVTFSEKVHSSPPVLTTHGGWPTNSISTPVSALRNSGSPKEAKISLTVMPISSHTR